MYWLFIYASKEIFHREPLYDVFDKSELHALHPPCVSILVTLMLYFPNVHDNQ